MNRLIVLFSLLISLSLTGCGNPVGDSANMPQTGQVDHSGTQSTSTQPRGDGQTITVFAAASLTGAFQEIGKDFEAANPGVRVSFNFAGSQILRTQLEQGASADIFASADHTNMDLLVADNLVAGDDYQDFVTNKLIVILPPGNPGNVHDLGDLAKPKLKLVLADPSVPAGNYARQVILNLSKDPAYGNEFVAKVMENVVSNETDVKQVVTKVELGEADAGIVYVSDAVASNQLVTIPIPDQFNVTASYPIAILTHSTEPKPAAAFIAYIESPAGQAILIKWGFSPVSN